jgi:hypothetical protein
MKRKPMLIAQEDQQVRNISKRRDGNYLSQGFEPEM